nr:mechanosensitive ion channel domain-containing protein [Paenibacillus humicola]
MPNATLAGNPITNWSRMGKRRITFTLGAALDSDPGS